MERTYAHLTDEDHIKAAEEKYGIREPEKDSPLTPAVCDRCGEPLEGDWKFCPYCGFVYAPDAQEVQQKANTDVKKSYAQADPEDVDTQEDIDTLDALLDDPEMKAELLDRLEGELKQELLNRDGR
ncbi:MAG: zinc-ribbon domain-containing protein [Halobacteriaceae archaeon]